MREFPHVDPDSLKEYYDVNYRNKEATIRQVRIALGMPEVPVEEEVVKPEQIKFQMEGEENKGEGAQDLRINKNNAVKDPQDPEQKAAGKKNEPDIEKGSQANKGKLEKGNKGLLSKVPITAADVPQDGELPHERISWLRRFL